VLLRVHQAGGDPPINATTLRDIYMTGLQLIREILPLVAGVLTMIAPGLQSLRIIRTRNIYGLSVSTCVLLSLNGAVMSLMAFEYKIITLIAVNVMTFIISLPLLYLVSRRAFTLFVICMLAAVVGTRVMFPGLAIALSTPKWAQEIALLYGFVSAFTFLPQVWVTHRSRDVSALSLPNYVMQSAGMVSWCLVALSIGNWPLVFWDVIITLCVFEMLRLKLKRPQQVTIGFSEPLIASNTAPFIGSPKPPTAQVVAGQ